jgi:hypothetical protein
MQIDIYVSEDVQLLVDFEYEKEENPILYLPDGSAYPGVPECFSIYDIYFKMKNVTELIKLIYGEVLILELLQKAFHSDNSIN